MFTQILRKIFSGFDQSTINTTTKPKTSLIIYLLTEFFITFKGSWNFFLNLKNINFLKKDIDPEDLTKAILLRDKKKKHKELNTKLFYIKDSFLSSALFSSHLFRHEWRVLYTNKPSVHQVWLLYTCRPRYIFSYSFYFRAKQLYTLFNSNQIKTGVYTLKHNYKSKNIYWGFISFWKAIKIWVFSLVFFSFSFYILLLKRIAILPQTLFFWVSVAMLLYWLLSGFVFFIKKYQYSRYTSAIQRFWRRSYILFWLIESGLLLVFFYLMINSSQESFYMFDQGYFLKTHLFSWKLFLFKCILVVSLITYSYLILLNLKWSPFNKNIFGLLFVTVLLLYLVWTEVYQIYWVSNFYANFSWMYDIDEVVWSLEFDGRRTRMLNHYIMVLFLLKFWHIIFILACWVFFLLRVNELETVSYPLYSFNFQNFIILFLMMWLFMYPWFRHTYHWLAEIPYYWFYVDTHVTFYKILITDMYNYYHNIFIFLFKNNVFSFFEKTDFINWYLLDGEDDYSVFIKATIKNEILKSLL